MTLSIAERLSRQTFLTAAGTETYLLFQQGFQLREFSAFEVFDDDDALAAMERDYLAPILEAAGRHGYGLLLDALVWRAQPDFIDQLGYSADQLGAVNARAVAKTRAAVASWRSRRDGDAEVPVLIAADIGPRGDGYKVADAGITAAAARAYHRPQMKAVAEAGVDLACAQTMTNVAESIGIVEAAAEYGLSIIVSSTVETDGRLPDGSSLGDFITATDEATDGTPLFYMVNCAHPTHLAPTLSAARAAGESWLGRFKGLRANASSKSHEELDNSTELDRGNVGELAAQLAALRDAYGLRVIGGCCGTDHEHIAAIAAAAS